MNVGIITASLPAMSLFFTKSHVFKKQTYSSLRMKLFGTRHRSKTSASGHAAHKLGTGQPFGANGVAVNDKGYFELQEPNKVCAFKAEKADMAENHPNNGILTTMSYGVFPGTQIENYMDREASMRSGDEP